MIYIQGDIQLEPCKKPKGKKVFSGKEFVLAEGSTTGHKHLLSGDLDIWKDKENTYVFVKKSATLTHEEHGKHEIEKGWYILGFEQEHDFFQNSTRKVVD